MGHIYVGTLPLIHPWKTLHHLLRSGMAEPEAVAYEVASAANDRLNRVRTDANLEYCVWLLFRLASAARRPEFEDALQHLGIDGRRSRSAAGFMAQVSARLRAEIATNPGSGPFADFASLALRRVLHEALSAEQPTLFDDGPSPLERRLREQTTPTQLGHLMSRFFGDFLARILRFYIDKTIPLYIGPEFGFTTIADSEHAMAELSDYAKQLASSTDFFAGRWFNLHDWTASGYLGRDEVSGFVAHAVEKLQTSMLGEEMQA